MAILELKPDTPGRRGAVKIKHDFLHKGKPEKSLVVSLRKKGSGRNNLGRITVRHRGGAHKRNYRIVDFKRNKDFIPAIVSRIEYDPNRSAHIALLNYADGEKRYIVAPKGLVVGQTVISGIGSPIKIGNTLPLKAIPQGTVVHCVEMRPGKGAQIARSAGTFVTVSGRLDEIYMIVKLRSGESRKIHHECRATIGTVGNQERMLRKFGKAGARRHLGIRPTVRGVAMNPVDHPHGGGEGKTAAGRHPVSPTGVLTKGYKTRRNKRTDSMRIRSRHKS